MNFTTQKTARYFTLGELTESTEEIIFLLHGYGQLADEFIQKFESPANAKRYIIAPEALNKFYLKGFYGKAGAAWMTKEDRLNEIRDYTGYLENLFVHLTENFSKKVKFTVLGFSQGGAAACRWLTNSSIEKVKLILWGSTIPGDINFGKLKKKLSGKILLVYGDNDRFINNSIIKEEKEKLVLEKINYEIKKYSGKHDILPEYLDELKIFPE